MPKNRAATSSTPSPKAMPVNSHSRKAMPHFFKTARMAKAPERRQAQRRPPRRYGAGRPRQRADGTPAQRGSRRRVADPLRGLSSNRRQGRSRGKHRGMPPCRKKRRSRRQAYRAKVYSGRSGTVPASRKPQGRSQKAPERRKRRTESAD